MTNTYEIELKIVNAFKGFIKAYRLDPFGFDNDRFEPKFKYAWRYFTETETQEQLELFYEVKSCKRLIELFERAYPEQIDPKLLIRHLLDSLSDWIIEGNERDDQHALEKAAEQLIMKVQAEIKKRLMFVPLEGLEVEGITNLELGNVVLYTHEPNSLLSTLLQQRRTRYQSFDKGDSEFFKNVKAFVTCEVVGQPNQAIQKAIAETQTALNILRFYLASNYVHEQSDDLVARMGIAGNLNTDEQLKVFYIDAEMPSEGQFPGSTERRKLHRSFTLTIEQAESMRNLGLTKINEAFRSLNTCESPSDLSRRLTRAITWFAKGTSARSIVDSFLMYAIAIEGLLSENRTSKETYATQMAALVTCSETEDLICPIGGLISSDFAKQLRKATTLNDRFNIIRNHISELFDYRNKIAHGAVLENEVEKKNLLDFETLVRNAILSFLKNNWNTLGEFKDWVHKSTRLDFVPRATDSR